ncbi:MAG: hypothetical protein HWE16_00810 [Gammaproteobacteria bacterium]|nr:hypothetical protein [Gammaproteobacteria bacterium]
MVKMKHTKIIAAFLIASLTFLGCASVEVEKKGENQYVLKAWGSKNKTKEQLKSKVLIKAKELCNPYKYELIGSGIYDQKIAGMNQSIGGFDTYDPQNITRIFTQHIRCITTE